MASIIADAHVHSTEVEIEIILLPCTRNYFSKLKDATYDVDFGLVRCMLSLTSLFTQTHGSNRRQRHH